MKILSPLGTTLAGVLLAMIAGPAAADRSGDASARFLRKPMAVAEMRLTSKEEFLQQVSRAWDEQRQGADGRLTPEQVSAVQRALAR